MSSAKNPVVFCWTSHCGPSSPGAPRRRSSVVSIVANLKIVVCGERWAQGSILGPVLFVSAFRGQSANKRHRYTEQSGQMCKSSNDSNEAEHRLIDWLIDYSQQLLLCSHPVTNLQSCRESSAVDANYGISNPKLTEENSSCFIQYSSGLEWCDQSKKAACPNNPTPLRTQQRLPGQGGGGWDLDWDQRALAWCLSSSLNLQMGELSEGSPLMRRQRKTWFFLTQLQSSSWSLAAEAFQPGYHTWTQRERESPIRGGLKKAANETPPALTHRPQSFLYDLLALRECLGFCA